MKALRLMLCLGAVVGRLCAPAQGTFQNLDFEQAIDVPTYPGSPLILTANAFPGWTVYAGGVPLTEVAHDGVIAGPVALADLAAPYLVLDGRFSAVLGGIGLVAFPVSIAQSGTVPAGSESLRFLESGGLLVSFAGHPLPLELLGNGPNASYVYGANISAYAGQYGQLTFETSPSLNGGYNILDDITFSAQPITEPGVLPVLSLGALILSPRRRRRRARAATIR